MDVLPSEAALVALALVVCAGCCWRCGRASTPRPARQNRAAALFVSADPPREMDRDAFDRADARRRAASLSSSSNDRGGGTDVMSCRGFAHPSGGD